MTRLYRDRRFATYWMGQAASEFGDRVSELALPLIAITIVGASSTEVGILTAAVWAPQLLSLFIGAWVDQQPQKRRLLIVSDLLQALAVATLPLAWWLGSLTLVQLVAVALVAGVGRTLSQSAYAPFFASLVTRDRYVQANSLLSTTRSGSFVAGPALGGAMIQTLGAPVAMIVDAASFAFSAHMTGRVRVTERPPADHSGTLVRRAAHGFGYLWRHPYMAASLRCCTTLNFFSFVAIALVLLYASRTLGLSAGAIGLAYGAGAVAGLAGAVLAGRITHWIGAGRTIAAGAVLFSAPYALIPLASGPGWAKVAVLALVEAVSGFGIMLFDINLNALQTAVVHDDLRSRVSGAFSTVNYGIRPLGALVGGVLGSFAGVGPTLVIAAVGGTLSIAWLVRSPILGTRAIEELRPAD
ncbi:MFS transporter [Actinoplanes sp. RD1]|uniref:MFS transporter n=1 Tax=Actinoplanes sp. RD1 TaxID=3064538 RepID=UPI0027403E2F|nr:MFS transporter [Actinoplanes sp. RD1]